MGNIDQQYMDSSKTASQRIASARADHEARFQHYVDTELPAERQSHLDNIARRKIAKGRNIFRKTLATTGVVLAAGAGVAGLKATDGPSPSQSQPNRVIQVVNGPHNAEGTIAYDQATPAQKDEADYLATGHLKSDQP
jgi:hypothetical protein